uniref:hypothetical protein n=1 Tax=Diaporthe sojae TaxID=165439 RepID=UPI00240EF42B
NMLLLLCLITPFFCEAKRTFYLIRACLRSFLRRSQPLGGGEIANSNLPSPPPPFTLLHLNSDSLCISSKSCLNSLLSRSYSSTELYILSTKFREWFVGFIDGDGFLFIYIAMVVLSFLSEFLYIRMN